MTARAATATVMTGTTPPWYLYLIECRNGALYAGISNNVTKRYAAHASGKGAKYTRANPPLRLIGVRQCVDRAAASRAEAAIRKLTPAQKRYYIEGGTP